jgi:integrase
VEKDKKDKYNDLRVPFDPQIIRYLSTHKIRAWGITEALASGMDQASIMRIAGHASPQTMRHYVRTARIKKDIAGNFDNVFN